MKLNLWLPALILYSIIISSLPVFADARINSGNKKSIQEIKCNVVSVRFPEKTRSSDLDDYVAIAKKLDPYALITGWFWDWRGISVYRKTPGYHLGYDIAMPAETPVVAGWSGKVIAISPWASSEWGVTVLTQKGYSITYGHIKPKVSFDAWINPGDIIGLVAIDHVDIKIRDISGNPVDFGKTCGLLPVDPELILREFRDHYLHINNISRMSLKAKIQEISRLKKTVAILEDYLDIETANYKEYKDNLKNMEKLLDEELICRNNIEQEENKVNECRTRTTSLKKRISIQKTRLSLLQKEVSFSGIKTNKSRKCNSSQKDIQELIKPDDRTQLEEARKKIDLYEKLYSEGAVSKKELEAIKKNYKKTQIEIILNND